MSALYTLVHAEHWHAIEDPPEGVERARLTHGRIRVLGRHPAEDVLDEVVLARREARKKKDHKKDPWGPGSVFVLDESGARVRLKDLEPSATSEAVFADLAACG